MQKITSLLFLLTSAFLIGCATPRTPDNANRAAIDTILIITADNMNARVSSAEMNDLLKSEVAEFSKSLKKELQSMGKEVNLKPLASGSENDIAMEIARMPQKPGLLVQAYWDVKQNSSFYIVVDSLKIQYAESGKTMHFGRLDRREYLSIGPSAKPSDTPENHAKKHSQHIKTSQP